MPPMQTVAVLKTEPDDHLTIRPSLAHVPPPHHQNYQSIHNGEVYRADVSQPVQQTPSRQYQNVSPLLSQESHQRFDIPTKKRVYFTPEQRSQLEDLYKNQQYPTRDDKSALAKSLSIDENKIQVWFQNRRARDRRPRQTRRKIRASHGLNPFNLIQNMPYGSPNLFQNHHAADPASAAALNPYASRQLGFGYGMNAIFAPNWPTQPSIQNTTASGTHHFSSSGQTRAILDGWNAAPYATAGNIQQPQQQHQSQHGMNSRAASDNSFDNGDPIEQI